MFDRFKPDFTFGSYREVSPEFLAGQGIKALLIDIDNTLAPYEQAEPDEALISWFSSLERAGIKAALISNNKADRVELFNKDLKLPAYPDAHKPSKKTLLIAIKELGTDINDTAVMGDQLFTDAYGGKHLGMRAIIVPPIKDKKTLFFRFKRALEKPIMNSYYREMRKNCEK
jgi:HAD superfamily phosphatase (TIGR01668 family)